RPQNSVPYLRLSQLAHDRHHRRLGSFLRLLDRRSLLARLVPALSNEELAVDPRVDAVESQVFQVPRRQLGRDAGFTDSLFVQHACGKTLPRAIHVSFWGLYDLWTPGLGTRT